MKQVVYFVAFANGFFAGGNPALWGRRYPCANPAAVARIVESLTGELETNSGGITIWSKECSDDDIEEMKNSGRWNS